MNTEQPTADQQAFPQRMKEAHCLCGRIFPAGQRPETRDDAGNIESAEAEEVQAHQRECPAYQEHFENCYCRGQGGNNPHSIKPQTPKHLTLLWSCEPCGLVKIAVEVPIRARSVELKYWFGRQVGPRVTVSQQENACPPSHNETISLLVPMGEVGTRGATRVGGPLK